MLRVNLYNKRDFKACEARESGVYLRVNEHFEGKRNAKIPLLESFTPYFTPLARLAIAEAKTKSFSSRFSACRISSLEPSHHFLPSWI